MASHRLEAVFVAIESRQLMLADPADMRRALEPAIQIVSPGMIWTTNHTRDAAGLRRQPIAAVAAHVVKYAQFSVAVPDHNQRQPH